MAGRMGSLGAKYAEAVWVSDRQVELEGVVFGLVDIGEPRPAGATLVLKKPRRLLETYVEALEGVDMRRVLELGLNHGGSAAFFAALLGPERLVSLDVSGPVAKFDAFRASHPLGARIAARYGVSQADEAALRDILAEDFDGPLDLVLDDASHDYGLTRASWEILFPALRPGGCYAIEDWQWAHAPGFWDRADQPALSNLVFQLQMACAGRPDLVARVDVRPEVAFVWKGGAGVSTERLDLDQLCFMQGRTFTPL